MTVHQDKLERQGKIRALRAEGKKPAEIQKILGVSQWMITEALRFVDTDGDT